MKNRLTEIRQKHEESQQFLADSVGLSRQAIINIEKERVIPNGDTMIAIARHYNMNVTDIFFWKFCNP